MRGVFAFGIDTIEVASHLMGLLAIALEFLRPQGDRFIVEYL